MLAIKNKGTLGQQQEVQDIDWSKWLEDKIIKKLIIQVYINNCKYKLKILLVKKMT
jgi:hypothetical protein